MKWTKQCMAAVVFMVAAGTTCIGSAGTKSVNDLDKALAQGKEEGKLIFILFGRDTCGNCQSLRSMIQAGQVHLRASEIVYADVNCDDPKTEKTFYASYKVDGRTLPFVIVADSNGHQLASRIGPGSADEFTKLIRDARKQVASKPGGAGGASAGSKTAIAASDTREMRTWKLKSGATNEAALYSLTGSYVVLRKADGTKTTLQVVSLSADDTAYLAQVRAGPAAADAPGPGAAGTVKTGAAGAKSPRATPSP